MRDQIASAMDRIGVQAVVYNGGSTSLGQAGPYSDTEYYVIANSVLDLVQLLRHKHDVAVEQVDLLVATKWMVKHRFFYILGTDATGAIVPCNYDARLLRNRAIKLGYRAYLDSTLETDALRKQYLLSKAAIQLVYAYALAEGHDVLRPLFTPDGAVALVALVKNLPDSLAYTVRLKFIDHVVDSAAFEQDLRILIDMLQKAYLSAPWSMRSYLWRSVFAIKKGAVADLLCNKDKRQITALYDMIQTGITDRYSSLRTALIDILII